MKQMIDLDKLIDDIRAQIGALQRDLESLQRARDLAQANGYYRSSTAPAARKRSAKGGRRDELRAFLRKRGPMKSAEIVERSGIPVGTVANLLNEKDNFVGRNGLWMVNEPSADQPAESPPRDSDGSTDPSKSDAPR